MEFAVKVLTVDDTLQAELERLNAEGWQLVNGVKPMAVYFVGRLPASGFGAFGGISVDDSKVTILRAKPEKE